MKSKAGGVSMLQLARLRQSKGLTQKELAKQLSKNKEKIYFSKSAVSLYELGLRYPNWKKAKIIADFFEVSIDELFFGQDANELKSKEQNTHNQASAPSGNLDLVLFF